MHTSSLDKTSTTSTPKTQRLVHISPHISSLVTTDHAQWVSPQELEMRSHQGVQGAVELVHIMQPRVRRVRLTNTHLREDIANGHDKVNRVATQEGTKKQYTEGQMSISSK